jgi:pimeloyl-ACP methyl ester carboxylesterase
MRNVVLVHGLWHGSWCWSEVAERLAGRGIPSVAVDLDGHGLRAGAQPGSVTASSAAARLVGQIRRIGGGEPCVVVAHSMGGIVATAAAELAPELFGRLVYLAAFAPVRGLPALAYLGLPENAGETVSALLAGDPAEIGALRLGLGDLGPVRETFYGDVDPSTADAAIRLLTPDGPLGIAGAALTVTAGRFGWVPHSFLVCTKDNVVPAALQRLAVREIDAVSAAPTAVTELDSSHSPFLSRPDELTAAIAAAWSGVDRH